MSYIGVNVPGLSTAELALVNKLLKQLSDKSAGNRRRNKLYEGREAVRLLGAAIPNKYANAANIIGWPAKAVDLLADRSVLTAVDSETEDLGIDELARANELRVEVSSAITGMLLHGVSFLVSGKGDQAQNEPRGLLHGVAATDGTGEWNARSRKLDNFISVHDRGDDGRVAAFTLYLPSVTISCDRYLGHWRVRRTNGTGEVPVEPLRYRPLTGSRPYGRSRITQPVIGLTRSAMRVAIRMEGHADIYSVPQLLALGATAEDLSRPDGGSAIGSVIGALYGIPDDDQAAPGTERAHVQQIRSEPPTAHVTQLRQLIQLFSGETSIPVSSLGISDMANPTSADSYLASREDLISAAVAVMDGITYAIERAVARSLAYQHELDKAPADWKLSARWRPAAHLSHASKADAGAKQLGALPWLADSPLGPELVGLTEQQQKRAAAYQEKAQAASLLDKLLDASEPSLRMPESEANDLGLEEK